MPRKISYTVRLDGEIIGTRKSHRTYTHAVVAPDRDGCPAVVVAYCGRPDLADKKLAECERTSRQYSDRATSCVIVPVDSNQEVA